MIIPRVRNCCTSAPSCPRCAALEAAEIPLVQRTLARHRLPLVCLVPFESKQSDRSSVEQHRKGKERFCENFSQSKGRFDHRLGELITASTGNNPRRW